MACTLGGSYSQIGVCLLVGSLLAVAGCKEEEQTGCGDGRVNLPAEQCEPTDLMGSTCESLGYYGGILYCNNQCQFDTSHCELSGRCGDGTVQAGSGEECDGTNTNNETCWTLDYYGGTLACDDQCHFDLTGCEYCGDGVVQSGYDEECDEGAQNGQSPSACRDDCRQTTCGDGYLGGTEECEGTNFGGETCSDYGHSEGSLSCAGCLIDSDNCHTCGDGFCEGPETQSNCSSDCSPPATSVSAGGSHACALLTDGTVQCWGSNEYGQIGDGTNTDRNAPVPVPGVTNVVHVDAGKNHTCVVLSGGGVQCWGRNADGQLGNASTDDSPTPVPVSGISNAVEVVAGSYHSCALISGGTVKCWGQNHARQLGNDSTLDISTTPLDVTGLTNVTVLSLVDRHNCVVISGGQAKCWGYNYHCQLGDGNCLTSSLTPVPVSGVTTAVDIAAGYYHSCTVLSDGTGKCWGQNDGGIGDGTTEDRNLPTPVTGLTSAEEVSAAFHTSCALLSDDTLRCWGVNWSGQIGDGSTTDALTPVPVLNISDAIQVSAGSGFTCALVSGGAVWCWGSNTSGELGDGTNTDADVPQRVAL